MHTPLALDLRSAAAALSVSYKTLRTLHYTGKLPLPVRKIGGRCLIAVADIERFLTTGTAQPPAVLPDDITPPPRRKPGRPKKRLVIA